MSFLKRLFFNESYRHLPEGGGEVTYVAGNFYHVHDETLAEDLRRKGLVLTEEEHAAASEAVTEAAPEAIAPEIEDAQPDLIHPMGEQ